MTTYTTLSNALVAVGAKPFATTVQALRDNPIAIAEGDATAPVNTAGWHPYDKTFNNGSETGGIWSQAVDGNVATVTTPDFEDGWEYGFWFERVQHTSGSAQDFRVNLFRETSGAYAGASIVVNVSAGDALTGFFTIQGLRLVRTAHVVSGSVVNAPVGNSTSISGSNLGGGARHATAQKIARLQFSFSIGNIGGTGAAIYMQRRRTVQV